MHDVYGATFGGNVLIRWIGDRGSVQVINSGIVNRGNGIYEYTPTEAQTDYAHINVQWYGQGAVSKGQQYYTRYRERVGEPLEIELIDDTPLRVEITECQT